MKPQYDTPKMIDVLPESGAAHGVLTVEGESGAWINGSAVTPWEWFLYQGVRAGKIEPSGLLRIENTMARAYAMQDCDAWAAIEGAKDVRVVQKTARGTLLAVPWLEQRILKVTCPSTGQTYALGVPGATNTVEKAQAFVNRIDGEFNVET